MGVGSGAPYQLLSVGVFDNRAASETRAWRCQRPQSPILTPTLVALLIGPEVKLRVTDVSDSLVRFSSSASIDGSLRVFCSVSRPRRAGWISSFQFTPRGGCPPRCSPPVGGATPPRVLPPFPHPARGAAPPPWLLSACADPLHRPRAAALLLRTSSHADAVAAPSIHRRGAGRGAGRGRGGARQASPAARRLLLSFQEPKIWPDLRPQARERDDATLRHLYYIAVSIASV